MGHQIQAILGKREAVQDFADRWVQAELVDLPQDCALVFLTDALFDGITELFDEPDREEPSPLALFTSAIRWALEGGACPGPLAYIETDYAGGHGTQAGVLVERGRIIQGPMEGEGTINRLLAALGVWHRPGEDAFDALGLGRYRHMPL
ncbi:MAG: hypothetical protein HFF50_07185 [Lawsonibacter sp.]|nr:hypothetical protein [Lawsonibacter sp.]